MDLPFLPDPTAIFLPLVAALAVLAPLLLIRRMLRRAGLLRGLGIAYLFGALALSAALALALYLRQAGRALDGTSRTILLAAIACCWGSVGIGLAEELLIRRWLAPGGVAVPRLALDIGRAAAFVVVVLLTLSLVLGVQLSSVVISSTIISAVVGLALQDLLKNVFAGIALQAEQPFAVGHWVEINRQIGRVVETSWRATRVITVDGNYIIYPNSSLAQAELINYTLGSPIQAMHVQIGVAPGHPPNTVKRVLTEAALASPDVCRDPPPSIKVVQYGDYSVTYDVKFWLFNYDRYPEKRDAVMTAAWYHLQRAGIKLPFPVREVFVHQADPATGTDQQRQRADSAIATLRQVDLFAVLDEAELHDLAMHANLRLYGASEVLARQGEAGDTFFVIRSGRVRIDVVGHQNGHAVTVNQLGAGGFFGELALLTGAPRGATVIAEEDTEALVVSRDDLAPLLHANPALPERLGDVLAQRLAMNQAALESQLLVDDDQEAASQDFSHPTMVGRIRKLFRLEGRPPTTRLP
jgi:small-conductance mechanosensitive channel/CRP-like cAMP-binding protein